MKTVWKFPFPFGNKIEVDMPKGAEVIHFDVNYKTFCLWAIVDTERVEVATRYFRLHGTGHHISPDIGKDNHIATLQDGKFVWHIFEVGEHYRD